MVKENCRVDHVARMNLNGAPGLTRTGTPYGQQILNLSRLPIPPQGLRSKIRTIAMNVGGSIGVLAETHLYDK